MQLDTCVESQRGSGVVFVLSNPCLKGPIGLMRFTTAIFGSIQIILFIFREMGFNWSL